MSMSNLWSDPKTTVAGVVAILATIALCLSWIDVKTWAIVSGASLGTGGLLAGDSKTNSTPPAK